MNTGASQTLRAINAQVEELLDLVVQEVQLTDSQHQDAGDKYQAVGRWLAAPDSPVRVLNPSIYPQGSLRIGTTVNHWRHVEFDLDLVCELTAPARPLNPLDAYRLVLDRMNSSGIYAPILEPRYRCIRLNYAGNFHLDIVPAVPDSAGVDSTAILIPDRDKAEWHSSNPVGYANWFENQAIIPSMTKRALADARIEPLREPEPLRVKAPLKLAVQLLKRARDVAFARGPELAPSSIILTTLAASVYQKEDDATDALTAILNRCYALASQGPIEVRNPANPLESFTDSWRKDPAAYSAFVKHLSGLRERWLGDVLSGDFTTAGRALQEIFGKVPVDAALLKYADRRASAREQSHLFAARRTGSLLIAAAPGSIRVPGHTFFGGRDDE